MQRLQAHASTHIQFQHRTLPSGLTISVCEFDGWTAASKHPDNLQFAELSHLDTIPLFVHKLHEDGRCDWLCESCGATIATTSNDVELADAERSHKCRRAEKHDCAGLFPLQRRA